MARTKKQDLGLQKKPQTEYLKGFDMTSPVPPKAPAKKSKFITTISEAASIQMKLATALGSGTALAALLRSDVKFVYPSNKAYYPSMMVGIMGRSGSGKSSTTEAYDAVTKPLTEADRRAYEVMAEYKRECDRCPNNKKKPEAPDESQTAIRKMPQNASRPFIVNQAMQAEKYGFRTFMNVKEVASIKVAGEGKRGLEELFLALGEDGQFSSGRVTLDGVSGDPNLHGNAVFSGVPKNIQSIFNRNYFRNGITWRVLWVYIPDSVLDEAPRGIPREKSWDDQKLLDKLKPFQENMKKAEGVMKCQQLNDTADELSLELDGLVSLYDSEVVSELANRLLRHAWTFAMLLWVSEGCRYHQYLSDWMVYVVKYGMWSVYQLFGNFMREEFAKVPVTESKTPGPTNHLILVPRQFSYKDMSEARVKIGRSENWDSAKRQWIFRNFIIPDEKDGTLFRKTDEYYAAHPEDTTGECQTPNAPQS